MDIFNGLYQPLKFETEIWRVPGLDGYGAMQTGLGDGEFPLFTSFYADDLADADSHIDSAIALQGSIVTITDSFGNSYDNVLVKHVGIADKHGIRDGHNASPLRVALRWDMVTATSS